VRTVAAAGQVQPTAELAGASQHRDVKRTPTIVHVGIALELKRIALAVRALETELLVRRVEVRLGREVPDAVDQLPVGLTVSEFGPGLL
jgi:hypothetical protein